MSSEFDDEVTDFGFERVPRSYKATRVRAVFDSVVERYDVMNDLMSFGMHRWWKRFTVFLSGLEEGANVLDLAAGTGDLAALAAARVGVAGTVTVADINRAMLCEGRRRMTDQGYVSGVRYVQLDAESLPFPDRSFDCVTIGFGLRNVTDKQRALREMHRVLRPGAQVLVLEFSQLRAPVLEPLYDAYSFRVLPVLGQRIANDADSYRYLAQSIRMHPNQETLAQMMSQAGFEQCEWFNLSFGVVALHRGYRT